MMDRTERQKQGIYKWLKNNGIGLLCYCTGFGKTFTSSMVINSLKKRNPNAKILISVPTDILKQQWIESLVKFNTFFDCKIEVINTIIKHQWDVDLLIIDEIHGTASESFKKIFTNVKYKMILGLTGTLERLDGKEELIKTYCPVVDTVSIEEAVKNSWLSPYREYKVLIEVDLKGYYELNKKFINYFAYFNYEFPIAMKCATNAIYRKWYAKKLGLDQKQTAAIALDWLRCMQLRKKFIMSHPKKFEIAHKILEKRLDKKCITFWATIKDAEKIKYGSVLHSKQTKKNNRITREDFNTKLIGVLNTSKAADVGADFSNLSVGIIGSCDSSSIRKNQRRGRILRYEKDKIAEMFTLVIKGTVEEKWYSNSSNSKYITINEYQLDDILNGIDIQSRQQESVKDIKYRF